MLHASQKSTRDVYPIQQSPPFGKKYLPAIFLTMNQIALAHHKAEWRFEFTS
jgi:hypothetical protein